MRGRSRQRAPIVLFDGTCALCIGSVCFLLARDRARRFRFASLQGAVGQSLLREAGVPETDARGRPLDTLVLIDESGTPALGSDAVLGAAARLSGPWRLLGLARVIPRFARDAAYAFVAARRLRWFGHADLCTLGDPTLDGRLLDSID